MLSRVVVICCRRFSRGDRRFLTFIPLQASHYIHSSHLIDLDSNVSFNQYTRLLLG
jgi:hypothetical protein